MGAHAVYYGIMNRFERGAFGIPFGSMTDDIEARVIKNAMVIDVLGNVAAFADLQPTHMAAIQNEAGNSYGVLLAVSETGQLDAMQAGHRIELEFSPDIRPKVATPAQADILSELANRDVEDDEPLPEDIFHASLDLLPSLWYSNVAFTAGGLLFREGYLGEGFHRQYSSAVDYIRQTIRDTHTQAHREHNARIRSHLSDRGIDMSQVPKPELDDQRRQSELDEIDPEYSQMFAKAQELQLFSSILSSVQFAVSVVKCYVT